MQKLNSAFVRNEMQLATLKSCSIRMFSMNNSINAVHAVVYCEAMFPELFRS